MRWSGEKTRLCLQRERGFCDKGEVANLASGCAEAGVKEGEVANLASGCAEAGVKEGEVTNLASGAG